MADIMLTPKRAPVLDTIGVWSRRAYTLVPRVKPSGRASECPPAPSATGCASAPAPRGRQQADLGNRARQPVRPGVRGEEQLVEVAAAVFTLRQVGAHPQP